MSFTITATARYARPLDAVITASNAAPPSVKLLVTATGTSPTIPLNSLLSVVRIHADGTRHQVLTEQGPRLAGGTWTWLDIHCPYGQAVHYEATANGQTVTTPVPTWLLSRSAYLVHSTDADLAMKIDAVYDLGDQQTSSRSAKFVPVGGSAVFLSDGARDGFEGTIEFRCKPADLPRWDALFADDQVVLLNTPNTVGWDLGWMWLQPRDVTRTNPGGITAYRYRHVQMSYTQAADPIVDLQPAWSCADALAYWTTTNHVTSAGVVARYATSLDFLTDTRL